MKHIKAINQKAARIEEFAQIERRKANERVPGEDDVVALESPRPPGPIP